MVDKILYWIVLLSPIFYIPGSSLPRSELIFFHLCVASLFIAAMFDTQQRNISLRVLLVLLIIPILQLLTPSSVNQTMNGLMNLLLGCVGIWIITLYSTGGNFKICEAIVISGLINIGLTIGQSVGFNPILEMSHDQYGGLMGNAPRLADFLALTFPLAMRYSLWAGALWLLTGIYLHQYPVFLIAFLYCIIRYPAWRLYACGALASVIVLFHAHILQSLVVRLTQWQVGVDVLFQNPLLGIGIGNYPAMLQQRIFDAKGDHAMSSLVEFFFNFGLVGGAVILIMCWKEYIRNRLEFDRFTMEEITIISLFALCTVEYPFEIIRLWPIIIVIVSFYFITHKQQGESYVTSSHDHR